MSLWPPNPTALSRPAYKSLAKLIEAAIEADELKPGTRLPTQRELAESLGLSVQTVGRAYDALIRANLITGHVGRGTFVAARGGQTGRVPFQRLSPGEDTIDCSMLTPVMGDVHRDAMQDAMQAVARTLSHDALFNFRPRQALTQHRRVTLDWLRRCGLRPHADNVVTTNGNTPAMALALMTAAAPGDLVLCDEMSHHTLAATARYLGIRLSTVPSDSEAMSPAALAAACERDQPTALFLLPSGAHPETALMDLARRTEICRIARTHDLAIIENDAWGPLEPGRPAPFAELAPERTFYFTGLTKCLMPGMRVAWLVCPAAARPAVSSRNLAMNWMATGVMAEVASHMIAEGTAERLLQWQRAALARRNRMAARTFSGMGLRGNSRGLHVWLPLKNGWVDDSFVLSARHAGVATASGHAFALGKKSSNGVRICLGAPSETDLQQALDLLAGLATSHAEPSFLSL